MMPSSCLATSTCLLGYRWLYVSIVVCTFSCPSRSAISSGEKPISTSRLAWLCPYGIITTNRKSPVESRVLRFSVWFFHPFSNRKITLKEVELQEVFH